MISPIKTFNLAEKVDAIDAIKNRLLSRPNVAAEKLAEAFSHYIVRQDRAE
jgi:hypothetical protein